MKKYVLTAVILSSLVPSLVEAKASKPAENVIFEDSIKIRTPDGLALKQIIENSFKATVDLNATEEDHACYHSKEYIQHVDGKVLNYDHYIAHMKALHKALKILKIVFHDMIIEGNKVVTRHTAHAVKKDGKEIEVQVIAIIAIKDGKIISCNELTHMIKGEKSDRDIGSRE